MKKLNGKRVAILVADGFEQVELTRPRTALEDEGAVTEIVGNHELDAILHDRARFDIRLRHPAGNLRGELFDVLGQQLTVGGDLDFHRALPDRLDVELGPIDSMTAEVDVGKRHGTADQCHRNGDDYRCAFNLGYFGFCYRAIHEY